MPSLPVECRATVDPSSVVRSPPRLTPGAIMPLGSSISSADAADWVRSCVESRRRSRDDQEVRRPPVYGLDLSTYRCTFLTCALAPQLRAFFDRLHALRLERLEYESDRGAVGGEEDDGDGHAEGASQDRDASNGGTSSGGDGSTIVGELSRRERLRAARATDRHWWGGRSMSFSDLEPPMAVGREGEEASTNKSGARATECHSSQGEGGQFR